MKRLYLFLILSIFLLNIQQLYSITPKYCIKYCKPTCSKRSKRYMNIDKNITTSSYIPYGARKYARLVLRVSNHYGLNPYIFMAQIERESSWRSDIISWDKGYGLTQVTPSTSGINLPKEMLLDPYTNIVIGAQIKLKSIRYIKKKTKCTDPYQTEILTLRVYNGGFRFLKYELNYLQSLGYNPYDFNNQQLVCSRDLCFWKVNIVYVIKVLNSAEKYKQFVNGL